MCDTSVECDFQGNRNGTVALPPTAAAQLDCPAADKTVRLAAEMVTYCGSQEASRWIIRGAESRPSREESERKLQRARWNGALGAGRNDLSEPRCVLVSNSSLTRK